MEQRKFHPVADIFPLLRGAEFDALVESVKAKGLLNPITLHPDGSIIDGRNRYRACLKAGAEPRFQTWDGKGSLTAFAVAQNVDRRHLNGTERALLGKQLEPLYAAEAKERQWLSPGRPKGEQKVAQVKEREPQARALAAKAARTNPLYISDLKKIEREAPEVYAKVEAGEIEIPRAKRMLRQAQAEEKLKAAAKLARPAIERVDLRVCATEEMLGKVRGLDAIITDPPYAAEHVPLYGDLARLAAKALKPDGVLAVMCGQSYMPQIVEGMRKHISYRWTIAYLTTGGQAVQVWGRKVNTFWKPVLIFGEQPPKGRWLGDVLRSDMSEKLLDEWQQSVPGFMQLVERLTVPRALVCDPFLGVGTTAVACVKLHRRVVGCDVDPAQVETARNRCALAWEKES